MSDLPIVPGGEERPSPAQIFKDALLNSQHLSLLKCVKILAEKCQPEGFDGVSFEEFYQRQMRLHLEKFVLAVGDSLPDAAAELQKMVDALKLP
jgi:hypothetical protein